MAIFDSIKNPFKDLFISNKLKNRKKNLLIQFNDSMARIGLIEDSQPEEAINAYLALLNIKLPFESIHYHNIFFRLACCYQRLGKIGKALYCICAAPYYTDSISIEKERFSHYRMTLSNIASGICSNNKNKIRVLAVLNSQGEINSITNSIQKVCFQEIEVITSMDAYKKILHSHEINKFKLIIISSGFFNLTNAFKPEYALLKQENNKTAIFFTVPEEFYPGLIKEYWDFPFFIIHEQNDFIYSIVLSTLVNDFHS